MSEDPWDDLLRMMDRGKYPEDSAIELSLDRQEIQEIIEWREKAERWDQLKPETKEILEIATEYSYDDVMAGRLSPEYIKELLDKAFWEHGLQKGTWILEYEWFRRCLEAVKTHLESYPDEKDDEIYCITRHYPSTAGPRVFNSVLFLTHLETWHKQLKELLEETV